MDVDAPVTGVSVNRILVVKLADMGDAILATSAVGALRRAHPYARIDVLTAGAGAAVFGMCKAVDEVLTLNKAAFDQPTGLLNPLAAASLLALTARLRARSYDTIVLLHHLTTHFGARKFGWLSAAIGATKRVGLDNGHGTFLTDRVFDLGFGAKSVHDYGLDVVALLGADRRGARPEVSVPAEAEGEVDELLRATGVPEDFVVIHPSVGDYAAARNWYPERFAFVASALYRSFRLPAVLVGASDAMDASQQIAQDVLSMNLVGRTTVPQLASLLRRARLVIGADSGVVHLAAALEVPTIAIFGPSNQQSWSPVGAVSEEEFLRDPTRSRVVLVRSEIPCSPCFYVGFSLGRRDGCHLRTCLDLLSADRVTQIASAILTETAPQKSAN